MKHEVTLTLTVTVAGNDVDWKENLAGTVMDLSFIVADLMPNAVGGNLTPITHQGDSNYGTFKFYLHGSVSKEAEEEINKREMENEST
jgi:hypothetical protein